MPKEEKAARPAGPEAYLIKFDAGAALNGYQRMIQFVNGHGVLDRRAVAAARRDLCDQKTLKWLVDWPVLQESAKYWADRGATVVPCSEKEAEAYRLKLHDNPKGHLPKEKAPKAKAQTKPAASAKTGKGGGKTPPHKRGGKE